MLTGRTKTYAAIDHHVTYRHQITETYNRSFVLSSEIILDAVHEPSNEGSNQCASHSYDVLLLLDKKRCYKWGNEVGKVNY